VVLHQEGEDVAVRFMDPGVMVAVIDADGADIIASEARQRLARVAAALT